MILGRMTINTAYACQVDRGYLNRDLLDRPMRVARMASRVHSDAALPIPCRPVIYGPDGALLAAGVERVIQPSESSSAPLFAGDTWRSFYFDPMGLELPPGLISYGLHVGGGNPVPGERLLLPGDNAAGLTRYFVTDTYADGPETIKGPEGANSGHYAIVLELFDEAVVPDVEDLHISRLPFPMAQQAFGSSGSVRGSRIVARAGWHGLTVDPEQGAVAIVRSDGPLAELVGERVRVTRVDGRMTRAVYVYVHDEQAWPPDVADEDLSLSRRAWLKVGQWGEDSAEVSVEVMA